jgi:hypothetical protein
LCQNCITSTVHGCATVLVIVGSLDTAMIATMKRAAAKKRPIVYCGWIYSNRELKQFFGSVPFTRAKACPLVCYEMKWVHTSMNSLPSLGKDFT